METEKLFNKAKELYEHLGILYPTDAIPDLLFAQLRGWKLQSCTPEQSVLTKNGETIILKLIWHGGENSGNYWFIISNRPEEIK